MQNMESFITQEMLDDARERIVELQKDMLLKLAESAGISITEADVTESEIEQALEAYAVSENEALLTPIIIKLAHNLTIPDSESSKNPTTLTIFAKDVSSIIAFSALDLVQERMSGSK